ncbi:MAG: hypothetical protein WAQ28_03225 [Bacteroidia bacterium]
MKISNLVTRTVLGATLACFLITGCKKEETPAPTPANPTTPDPGGQQTQRASDQSNVENESNQAMDEANSALQEVSTTREMMACGMTIDSTYKNIGKLILNYSGPDCSGTKTRSGSITVQLPYSGGQITTWSTPGATATLTFNDYKVTYISTNKSLKFNGTHSVKNVNGGGWLQLLLGTPIVHKVRANMQISFDDSTSCSWQFAKVRTYHYMSGQLKASIAGDTVINTYNHIAMWGVNRLGENFKVDVPTPVAYYLAGNTCLYKPTGEIVLYSDTNHLTITYGVDASGNVVTGCPYGYKYSWMDMQNNPQQLVIAY